MSPDTPLFKGHDLSQRLQDEIEVLPNVERAFVHVDHEATHLPVSVVIKSPHLGSNNLSTMHLGTSKIGLGLGTAQITKINLYANFFE